MKLKDVIGSGTVKDFDLTMVSIVEGGHPIQDEDDKKDPDKPETGAFVGVKFSELTVEELLKLIEALNIENPTNADELHCTVMYTKSDVPDLLDMDGQSYDPPLVATGDKFEIFKTQDENDCLVLRIKCDELVERHEAIKDKYSAVYTHDEFKPHITLSYNCNEFDLDAANEKKSIDSIEIVEEYVTSLNSDWV